jgi:ribonuclease BN (tRNA processing enzyme)
MLGVSGGELGLQNHSISYLVDDKLLIDAGGLLHSMTMESLLKIDNVLISHTHMDHIKDLPLWGDLIFGQRSPINVRGAHKTLDAIKANIFNWIIWPDFTSIPTKENPIFKFNGIEPTSKFSMGGYKITSIEVNHTVLSTAFIIDNGESSFLYSSDTTNTDEVWKVANRKKNLKAIFMEISFSNALQTVADASKHYSPTTLAIDLKKIKKDIPIYLYHIKPSVMDDVLKEVSEIKDKRIRFAKMGDVVEI